MSKEPRVTIIILNWNGANDTIELLRNLSRLKYKNFSVLVVDNGSNDNSVTQIRKVVTEKNELLVLGKNYGFAEGNNQAIEHLKKNETEYYLLLNNDTLVDPNFLTLLVDILEKNPKVAATAPTIYFAGKDGRKTNRIWYAGGWFNFFAGGAHHNTNLKSQILNLKFTPTEFITGCCMLIRKEALVGTGQLFDPLFFAYGEDADLCQRLLRAGWHLAYVPSAKIWHKLAASSGGPKSANFWYYNVRNNFLVMSRYASWYHWPIFIIYFLFYKPLLLSLVGAIIRPRPDKWLRIKAIVRAVSDTIHHQYGKATTN